MKKTKEKIDKTQEVLDALNERFEGVAKRYDDESDSIERVSSGSLILDRALGGGYPAGKIVEVYGLPSLGKSTSALHFLKQISGTKVIIDTEGSYDADYAKRIGVDTSSLIVATPDTLEQGMEVVRSLAGEVEAIVFDSIAEIPTQKELEGEMTDRDIGDKARIMSKALRLIKAIKERATIMFINQVRTNPAITYGSNVTTPGGWALNFGSHVRLEIFGAEKILNKEEVIGHYMKVKVIKNKLGKPWQVCKVPIIFDGYGISLEQEVLDLGIESGVIVQKGSWVATADGTNIAQGLNNARLFLKDNPEFLKELLDKL